MRRKHFLKMIVLSCALMISISAFAQKHQVSGVVTDETNQTVPGVAVMIKGTTTGTVTDMNGQYTIEAADGDVLEFSFIGYSNKEQVVSGSTLNANLESEAINLNEIVAVGYGVQKKSDLTGAVASVNETDLRNRSTSDAAAALQGKAAGVQVLNYSGAPGKGAEIRVRGYSSNSSYNSPIMIVDGLKVDNIQYLDPSMIQSIEVLKDAASAAIYGAQAGNGVVLITTKTGSDKGTSAINYDVKMTRQTLGKKAEIFDNAKDFIAYKIMEGTDLAVNMEEYGYDGTETDWIDVVFAPSWSKQHSLTFQGGNKKGHFFTALNYVNNDGIVRGDKDVYKRLSTQINADYKITDWLTVGVNNSIEKWSSKSVSEQSQYNSVLNSCLTLDPLTPVYYDDPSEFPAILKQGYDQGKIILKDPSNGRYYATSKYQDDTSGNPLLQRDRVDSSNEGVNVRGTAFLNITPLKGLVYTSRLGYRITRSNSHSYNTPYWATSQANSENYNISASLNSGLYYQWENFFNYDLNIGVNTIGAMVGMSYVENNTDNISASAEGKDILKGYEKNFQFLNYVNSKDGTTKSFSNAPGKSTNISYFGRLIYSYDNRYSLQANFRADAFDSSKLSKQARWGYFPSFSAGWTISNESFFADLVNSEIVTFLKIRGSWGRNGNVNVLNNYQYNTTINYNGSYYQYGVDPNNNETTLGSMPSGLANPDLKWETSEQVDIGLDARFLNSRLSLGIDYFNKKTKDLLVDISPVAEVGVSSTTINGGSVLNRGVEFELTWKDKVGEINYSVSGNLSTLHNEVTYLDPSLSKITGSTGGVSGTNNPIESVFEVGQPIWYFRGYKYNGVNKETGAAIIEDVNGDGTITSSDMTYIGKALPDATYGLTISLDWKGIDFNLYGTGTIGNEIFNVMYRCNNSKRNSMRYYYDNAWTPENKNGSMPDPKLVSNDWTFWGSDACLFNGSFFKVKQIQIGYTLPSEITKKALINKMRIYASFDDILCISKYPGFDPETATTSMNARMGYDNGSYPTTRKIVLGANITF